MSLEASRKLPVEPIGRCEPAPGREELEPRRGPCGVAVTCSSSDHATTGDEVSEQEPLEAAHAGDGHWRRSKREPAPGKTSLPSVAEQLEPPCRPRGGVAVTRSSSGRAGPIRRHQSRRCPARRLRGCARCNVELGDHPGAVSASATRQIRSSRGTASGEAPPSTKPGSTAVDTSLALGSRYLPCRASISLGTTECTSPTMPRSATPKTGASGSLLIAMMVPESFIPTRCCMAPEMPHAR